jgi:hypothetical protein
MAEQPCHFYAKLWKHKGELGKKNVWGLTLVNSQPNIFLGEFLQGSETIHFYLVCHNFRCICSDDVM